MGEKHRHFTREFKLTAVQLVTEKGRPVCEVARELDIHPQLLHTLVRGTIFLVRSLLVSLSRFKQ